MASETPAEPAIERKTISPIHVAAVVAGNGLEFYDFLTYAIFAVYIAKAFFPAHGALSLLLTLATFGIGFVTRPVGAIVLGGLGDRIGRKPSMLISFGLMGLGMAGVALTPTYAQIGIAAPLLIILFRLIQGFALGGEVGPTTAYMVESAPPSKRGLYGSMQAVSQDCSVLVAGLVGVAISNVLTPGQLAAWGWRVAFLLGLVIVPFGIILRRSLPETLHAPAATARTAIPKSASRATDLRPHLQVIVLVFVLLVSATIGTYVTDYMTTFSLDTLHLPASVAFGVTVVTSLVSMVFDATGGTLSDRFGRRPLITLPLLLLAVAIVPGFWLITQYPTPSVLYGVMALLALPLAMSSAPVIVALTESLPRHVRSGTVATVYAFAISIFGGSTQFMITWLIKVTHDPMAPAFYWSAAALLGLLGALYLPESAPGKVDQVTALGAPVALPLPPEARR